MTLIVFCISTYCKIVQTISHWLVSNFCFIHILLFLFVCTLQMYHEMRLIRCNLYTYCDKWCLLLGLFNISWHALQLTINRLLIWRCYLYINFCMYYLLMMVLISVLCKSSIEQFYKKNQALNFKYHQIFVNTKNIF